MGYGKYNYKEFWVRDELTNIAREDSLIQGEWNLLEYFKGLKSKLNCIDVVDFGCGTGRLAPAFSPSEYVGIDINPFAIIKARRDNPGHTFLEVDLNSQYPSADMYLVFTVFLHLDDKVMRDTLTRMQNRCYKYLVISEQLGREWRQPGSELPLYNRELKEYRVMLSHFGFYLTTHERFLNEHYASQDQYKDRNCKTSVLVFERR
jgi:SAM-dependent methyltransferase